MIKLTVIWAIYPKCHRLSPDYLSVITTTLTLYLFNCYWVRNTIIARLCDSFARVSKLSKNCYFVKDLFKSLQKNDITWPLNQKLFIKQSDVRSCAQVCHQKSFMFAFHSSNKHVASHCTSTETDLHFTSWKAVLLSHGAWSCLFMKCNLVRQASFFIIIINAQKAESDYMHSKCKYNTYCFIQHDT